MAERDGRSSAAHLPKQGGDTTPGPPAKLPRQRRGTTPQMRGRYPDYDVLSTAQHWDQITRRVVLDRLANVPSIRFFTAQEARTLKAFCDVVMGQDSEPRIPVLEMVDDTLGAGRLDGFRHDDMPADPETWRLVAANLDRTAAQHGYEDGFPAADSECQHEIVQGFSTGEARVGPAGREGLGCGHARGPRSVLLPPLGLERDRLRRARLPAWVRAFGRWSARAVGGAPRVRGGSGA